MCKRCGGSHKRLIRERLRDRPVKYLTEDNELFNKKGDFICPKCDKAVSEDEWNYDMECCIYCIEK